MRLFKWSPAFAAKCGVKFRLRAVNRQFLEREIFDHLNQLTAKSPTRMKCLFLGMHYYTWHYPRLLKMDFYSLDMDPEQAVYGPLAGTSSAARRTWQATTTKSRSTSWCPTA